MLLSNTFTGKKIALTAMFIAVAYGISFLEFPIFPVAPYLKLDFSFSIQRLGAYILGPILGEIMVAVIQLLRFITSSTGGVGEIANFVAATCFVLVPSVIYQFKKGLPTVFISLFIGTVLQIVVSLISNRFLTFPLYMGEGAEEAFNSAFWIIVAFNAIKCVANAIITLLLYKRLKKVLNKFL
ncbi:MAG: ECF transporter S component [Clostridia bacterium]|nr:ECF transporter S component [Clostridia bacterium]